MLLIDSCSTLTDPLNLHQSETFLNRQDSLQCLVCLPLLVKESKRQVKVRKQQYPNEADLIHQHISILLLNLAA